RQPPVPDTFKRRMLALGSGEPTRAICSTLLAQAFGSIGYPILPGIEVLEGQGADGRFMREEVLHIRHHSLYTPRDFRRLAVLPGGQAAAGGRIRLPPRGVGV